MDCFRNKLYSSNEEVSIPVEIIIQRRSFAQSFYYYCQTTVSPNNKSFSSSVCVLQLSAVGLSQTSAVLSIIPGEVRSAVQVRVMKMVDVDVLAYIPWSPTTPRDAPQPPATTHQPLSFTEGGGYGGHLGVPSYQYPFAISTFPLRPLGTHVSPLEFCWEK